MASLNIPEPLRFKASSTAASTAGPISDLAAQLEHCDTTITCWPHFDDASNSQSVLVYSDHTDWFNEVRSRTVKKSWHPDLLRTIAADTPTALRLAGWIRKAQLPGRTDLWRRGEYIRTLDPIIQGGVLLAAAGAEFRIATAREMIAADHRGRVEWATPARGEHRQLELSVAGVEVQVLKLEPLTGDDPITVMAELPRRDFWRNACGELRKALAGAKHQADTHSAALEQLAELQQMVIRLRPASTITPELINGRRFQAVALHPDLAQQLMDGIFSTRLAVAAAERELLITRQRPMD